MKSNKNEVSIEWKLTKTGVSAKAVSRAVSACDRLVGNVFNVANVYLEGVADKKRAATTSEVELIKAVGQSAAASAEGNDEFVQRALDQYSKSIFRKQKNREHVVDEALTQLATEDVHCSDSFSDKDALDDMFMDRFEVYAEEASTEELRERWGRVLASEIRQPGTFSRKVMRVVDELDSETALLFEELCRWKLGDQVLRVVVEDLGFSKEVKLLDAGLIVEPASGIKLSLKIEKESDFLFFTGERYAFSCHKDELIRLDGVKVFKEVSIGGGELSFQVYQLTDAGSALSSILSYDEEEVFDKLITALIDKSGFNCLALHRLNVGRDEWEPIASYPDILKVVD